jgi:flagellar biosynthesis/type III secretory pathway chaperone
MTEHTMTEDGLAERLQALIAAERDALLSGDFDRISAFVEEKQSLSTVLQQSSVSADKIAPIRDGLRRNQELYDHTLAGIRNVAARLGEMNRARKSMNTYDSQGRKHCIEAPEIKRLERRA